MITSEKQLLVTIEKINTLKQSLKAPANKDMKAIFQKAARAQTEALIEELGEQVKEYNSLRSDGLKAIKVKNASDWLLIPIRFRIAKKMSQDAFSHLVGVSVRQIARYEAEEYSNVQTETLKKILDKLPISVTNTQITEKEK